MTLDFVATTGIIATQFTNNGDRRTKNIGLIRFRTTISDADRNLTSAKILLRVSGVSQYFF